VHETQSWSLAVRHFPSSKHSWALRLIFLVLLRLLFRLGRSSCKDSSIHNLHIPHLRAAQPSPTFLRCSPHRLPGKMLKVEGFIQRDRKTALPSLRKRGLSRLHNQNLYVVCVVLILNPGDVARMVRRLKIVQMPPVWISKDHGRNAVFPISEDPRTASGSIFGAGLF